MSEPTATETTGRDPDVTGADRADTAPGDRSARRARPDRVFDEERTQEYRGRWEEIQTRFAAEPRDAVEDADTLIADVVDSIRDRLEGERDRLAREWKDEGGDVGTEDLRRVLQRYRDFLDRLLQDDATR